MICIPFTLVICYSKIFADANKSMSSALTYIKDEHMLKSLDTARAEKSNAILDAYFKAVTTHDVNNIIAVFDPDAKLVTEKQTYQGKKNIAEYYTQNILKFSDFYPEPGERYFSIAGDSIAVEIKLHADGMVRCIGDFFVFNDQHITKMHVYARQAGFHKEY